MLKPRWLHACRVCLVAPFLFAASGPPAAQASHRQKQDRVKNEETFDYYQKWLKQDVLYLITPEEYSVFKTLTTADEKDNFIEQFWVRRDPDPSTSENEFKIEHYRRILYSNENFSAGIPGWRTDRGRIYIQFGPPDRKESMPAGGHYHRSRKEGGGDTSVFPFEIWEYRNIPGVESDVELEFVDDGGGNLYKLTYDNQRKDELIHSGFMGPTLDEIEDFELSGSRLKQNRVAGRRFSGDLPDRRSGFETEKDKPFSKLLLSSRINKPPVIKFKDLETVVNTSIHYNLVGFGVDVASLRVSEAFSLATVTVNVPHTSLTFKQSGQVMVGRAEVFGQVTSVSKKIEGVFEEDVIQETPVDRYQTESGASMFQKKLFLRPGLYKLNLVVKDVETGNLGSWEGRLEVPDTASQKLAISSIILAQDISAADPARESLFDLGKLKVVPRVPKVFGRDESMGFYFQIYNPLPDQSTGKPDLSVQFSIVPQGSAENPWRDCSKVAFFAGDHSTVARLSSLKPYSPGDYMLKIRVEDRISGQKTEASIAFTIDSSS